ncbi:hypothetical protein MKK68_05855 [Methylobacterium sp. E-016]|uniref:hypothetical protein n=1 Tax=Methylobacterium sp. E-016 TaxID=2836556 RepID=UPI001FBBB4C3|nr:hypothetical protein [Methylobacterium sp. E-016]MCJ2075181.1 hypothetical protein [Methylobacterium sp. E-016]
MRPHGPTRRLVLAAGASALAARPALAGPLPSYPSEDFAQSVGINTHFGHDGTPYVDRFARCAAALDALGIRHLRDDIVLPAGEPPSGPPPQFRRIAELARAGYRFSLVFYDGLDVGPLVPPRRLPDIAAWSAGGLAIAEGSNEPNIAAGAGRPQASAEHQRALYRAARNAGGAVKVAGPSYVQANVAAAESLANAVDYGNIHPYPGMEHPENAGNGDLRRFVAAAQPIFGRAPLLATENGYHTALATRSFHFPVSEAVRARYTPRLLLWSFLQGIRRTYLYELAASVDRGEGDPEGRFGLLRFDGSATPTFSAVANLMRLFRAGPAVAGPALDVALDAAPRDLQAIRFLRGDGAVLVPLWLGIDGWDRVQRRARPDAPAQGVTLTLSGVPKAARLHRFADDGSVGVETLGPARTLTLGVTDRLAILELV